MALGPVMGGLLITRWGEINGVRIAFIAAFCLAGVSLLMQQGILDEGRKLTHPEASPFRALQHMKPALQRLLVSDILIRFCEQIPYAFVVIWAVNLVGISPAQFGMLTAIEMIVAMLIYIPVATLADRGTKKPFVVITYGFFTLFPFVLLFARSFWLLVIAFVIRGLKEFGEPTRKALIMDLCPEGLKASTFGAYYLMRDMIVSLAAFGGALLWQISPETNFIAAFGFGIFGTLWFALFGRDESNPVQNEN